MIQLCSFLSLIAACVLAYCLGAGEAWLLGPPLGFLAAKAIAEAKRDYTEPGMEWDDE